MLKFLCETSQQFYVSVDCWLLGGLLSLNNKSVSFQSPRGFFTRNRTMVGTASPHANVCGNKTIVTQIRSELSGDITLCKFYDAPAFLRENPYIIHGYRPVLSMRQCLRR